MSDKYPKYVNETHKQEHDNSVGPARKRVQLYLWNTDSLSPVRAEGNSNGSLVTDEKETTDFEGAPVTVGTTAVEMTFTGTTSSIMIQSDPDNTGIVWVGKSNVTSAGANGMAQLEPGDSLSLDLNDSSNAIYAVSDTASQTVYKLALV